MWYISLTFFLITLSTGKRLILLYCVICIVVQMSGRTIYDESVKTQSVAAVSALLKWRGRGSDPLPDSVEIGQGENRLVLVLSNKKDCFYTTTAHKCSCPSQSYRGGRCKHMRKYYPQIATRPTEDSIRPTQGWIGPDGKRANGPIDLLPGSSHPAMITLRGMRWTER